METHVLITGATGNIGKALIDILRLVPGELKLTAASRGGESVSGVSGRALDLLDHASARAAMLGMDRVFLLTPAHPEMEKMTANAVAAAKETGVRHLVRISGAGADADSDVAIARLQGRCDRLISESGIPYTLLRPKNFMQNFSTFLAGMVRSGAVYSSQGDGRVPFIDVRDIAEVAATVLRMPADHQGQAYVLTGPEALTNAEAVAMIGASIGRPVQVIGITEAQAVAAMRESGMPDALVEVMSSLNQVIAAGWVAEVSGDVARLTGKAPRRFADFVQEHRQSWLANTP